MVIFIWYSILTLGNLVPLFGGLTSLSEISAIAAAFFTVMRRSRLIAEEAYFLFAILGLTTLLFFNDYLSGGVNLETLRTSGHYITIIAYVVLLRKSFIVEPKRVILFAFLLTLSELLALFVGLTTERTTTAPWQLALAGPTSLLLFSVVTYVTRANRLWLIGALLVLAALHIGLEARALALGAIATMILVFLWSRKKHSSSNALAMKFVLLGTILVPVAGVGIDFGMRNNLFGEELGEQYVQQFSNTYGLIGGSRPQLLVGAIAALDRPFFGYGTHQSEAASAYFMMLIYEIGDTPLVNEVFLERKIDSGMLPAHSAILEAWHLFGIFGLIFWLWVMHRIVKVFFTSMSRPGPVSSVVIFLVPQLLFSIVFNPGPERSMFAVSFAFLLAFLINSGAAQTRYAPGRTRRFRDANVRLRSARSTYYPN